MKKKEEINEKCFGFVCRTRNKNNHILNEPNTTKRKNKSFIIFSSDKVLIRHKQD